MQRQGEQGNGPYYDLVEFQAAVESGDFHVYKTRALNVIRSVRKCGRLEATEYAKQVVLSLVAGNYAHTLTMHDGQVHDVYGKLIQAEGWYVKIEINIYDGQPGIVSCHPAAHDLATRDGVIPRSRKGHDDR